MIRTPGTLPNHGPQPDIQRVCPQCNQPMHAVVVVIADYRPAQTVCVCLECSYTALDGGTPTGAAC